MPKRKGWSSEAHLSGVEDPEKNLPPWERANPAYGVGAGKDEKANINVSARITVKENRDLAKIVQHRRVPAIENTSDALRVALVMLRYWYATKLGDMEMKDALDVEMWENERLAQKNYRLRVLEILDAMEVEMAEAQRLGYENRLKDLRAQLAKYKKKLTDEELLGKANKLYVLFSPSKQAR